MEKTKKTYKLREEYADAMAYGLAANHFDKLVAKEYPEGVCNLTKDEFFEKKRDYRRLQQYCRAKEMELSLKYLQEIEIYEASQTK